MNENTYTRDVVKAATLKYFNGDELATSVWMSKYALSKDDIFYELTPDDMHKRMSVKFHAKMKQMGIDNILSENEIYKLFENFNYIIPQGSVMSQLGNYLQFGSLSNCTVIDSPKDSYGGIFHTDEMLAQLMKRRCGVGVDISTLRPAMSKVSNSAGTSAGAVSFMDRFSNTTREVAQDGRRGALMLTIDVNHPDAGAFAIIKSDSKRVTGANISIQLTNKFMRAVEADGDFIQRWPIDADIGDIKYYNSVSYDVIQKDIDNNFYYKKIKAKKLWDIIVTQARNSAEPGIMFKDRHHKYSPSSIYDEYKNIVSNPCVTGDTLITTSEGKFRIDEISERFDDGETFLIASYNEEYKIMEWKPLFNAQLTKENAEILEIETEDGDIIKLTPDHKVLTEEHGWIIAAKLDENCTILKLQ